MALVNLTTNLKSLRYGKDRVGGGSSNQPYIKSFPPNNLSNLNVTGGVDFLLRGGTLVPSRIVEDTSRLTQMFFDFKSPNGLLFTAKQNLLSRTAVSTQASNGILNEGIYLPSSTILQAAGNFSGLHLNKQGIDPTKGISKTSSLSNILGLNDPLGLPMYTEVIKQDQNYKDNRLFQLKNAKVGKPQSFDQFFTPLFPSIISAGLRFASNTLGGGIPANNNVSSDPNELLKYPGGPGSTLGIGQTSIKRYVDSTAYKNVDNFTKKYYLLQPEQIAGKESSKDSTNISDFRIPLLNQQDKGIKKNILSKSPNYSNYNKRIEGRVNLGDPGRRNKNVSSYTKGLGAPLDLINASSIYKDSEPSTDYNDLVKFRIGIIDNNDPSQKTYMHFRAFLDSMSDNYSAEWNAEKFMGRGEKFYKYGGFDRTISLAWTVAAQSKEELIPMYKKLNFLASSLTPDYSPTGYMRGNLATLTVGGYLNEQPGIITSINYGVPQESPWEIAINDEGNDDNSVKQLPHIIKVTGFNFIPIHNFVPRLQQPASFGKERYIALSNGSTTNYEDSRIDAPTRGIIPPPSISAPLIPENLGS